MYILYIEQKTKKNKNKNNNTIILPQLKTLRLNNIKWNNARKLNQCRDIFNQSPNYSYRYGIIHYILNVILTFFIKLFDIEMK